MYYCGFMSGMGTEQSYLNRKHAKTRPRVFRNNEES